MAVDFVEGRLRHDWTIDNKYIQLIYSKRFGYYIECGMNHLCRCQSFDEAEIVFDTLCLCEINYGKYVAVVKAAKTEHRRLTPLITIRGEEWKTPASRHNEAVYGAIRRVEGYRPVVHKGTEKWVKK